jgi:hypothetical protein
VHTDNLALRKRLSNVPRAKFGKWSGIQTLDLVYDEELSDTAQAILGAGKNVPANVRTAARRQVSNIEVVQKLVRKARSVAELIASIKTPGPGLISGVELVLDYVGDQCGSTQTSLTGVSGTEAPVTTSTSH